MDSKTSRVCGEYRLALRESYHDEHSPQDAVYRFADKKVISKSDPKKPHSQILLGDAFSLLIIMNNLFRSLQMHLQLEMVQRSLNSVAVSLGDDKFWQNQPVHQRCSKDFYASYICYLFEKFIQFALPVILNNVFIVCYFSS